MMMSTAKSARKNASPYWLKTKSAKEEL
jgi:hypothetical protein